MNPEFARAAMVAAYYRKLGLCPLPSRMDRKGPMLDTFAQNYSGEPVPESVYENWATTNIQIITGTRSPTPTKIIVVDCDGEEAKEAWIKIKAHHNYTETSPWIAETGSGGLHTYFLLPPQREARSGLIWGIWDTWGENGKGKWVPHKEIRILADNALVIAPPSQHVETKDHYRFLDWYSPKTIPLPEIAPQWLLDLPRIKPPRVGPDAPTKPFAPRLPVRDFKSNYDRDSVLSAIGGKLAAAKGLGLAAKSDHPNANGWVQCYVPGRETPGYAKSASGSFQVESGILKDMTTGESMTLFDIGVATGRFSSWYECMNYLGDQYLRGK